MATRSAGVIAKGMLIAALLLLLFLGWQLLTVDACLDAGGSFDYGAMRCDQAANHPYPGFWPVHGLVVLAAGVAAALGLLALIKSRSNG
jgi:hypothetical protein